MSTSKGRNLNVIKTHNLSAILLRLLQSKTVSRVELAEELSLSSTTITNLTAELLEDEIITEEEIEISGKHKRVGRPRRMLRLIPSARYAVGVHIGVGMFRVAITNLIAKFVINRTAEFDLSQTPENVIIKIAEVINQTIKESGIDRRRIIGVGVGASGLVDTATGINVLAPRLNWEDVPIRSILEDHVKRSICVDNNVRSMALGEAFFGIGREVSTLAFVYGRIGVGAGFVVDGKLFRGSGAGAGEIGHTVILGQSGETCSCGNTGCLETLISEPVLLKQAQIIAIRYPDGLLSRHLADADTNKQIESIFAAARSGDEHARKMIEERASYLGIALANLVNIMNPELILLGGMFAQGQDMILPVAETKMRSAAFAGLGEKVRIAPTSFGWRAGVIGASSLALTSFFYQPPEET
jgi:predicted NBD/HSP70 family sugar kinase